MNGTEFRRRPSQNGSTSTWWRWDHSPMHSRRTSGQWNWKMLIWASAVLKWPEACSVKVKLQHLLSYPPGYNILNYMKTCPQKTTDGLISASLCWWRWSLNTGTDNPARSLRKWKHFSKRWKPFTRIAPPHHKNTTHAVCVECMRVSHEHLDSL